MSSNDWLAVNVGGEKTFLGRFPVGLFGIGGIGYQTRQAPKWSLSDLRWFLNNYYQWVLSNNMLTLMFPMLQLQKTLPFFTGEFEGLSQGFLLSQRRQKSLVASRRIPGIPYPHASALQLVPVSWRIFFPLPERLRLQICPLWKCSATDLYFRMSSVFLGKIGGIREAICWALGGSFFGTFFLASGTSRDPDTNSKSTWKMDGWKTIFSFWVLGLFSGAMLVLGRVPVLESRNNFVPRKNALREKQILTIT